MLGSVADPARLGVGRRRARRSDALAGDWPMVAESCRGGRARCEEFGWGVALWSFSLETASGERRRQGKLPRRLELNLVGSPMRGSMLEIRWSEANSVVEEDVAGAQRREVNVDRKR